jgi:HEAT repeat protein
MKLSCYILIFLILLTSCSKEKAETPKSAPAKKAQETSDDRTSERDCETLIEQLSDKNWRVRVDAAIALGELRDKRAIIPLAKAVNLSGDVLSEYASDALVKIGEPVVEPLKDALNNPDNRVRENAVYCLGRISHPSALETLRKFWKEDKNVYVRMAAAFGIAEIAQDEKARQFILEGLESKDGSTIVGAIRALGMLEDREAVRPLIGILLEGSFFTAPVAAESLVKIGDKRAIAPLIEVLRMPLSEYVQRHEDASCALNILTGQDFGTDYDKWKAWYEKNKGK